VGGRVGDVGVEGRWGRRGGGRVEEKGGGVWTMRRDGVIGKGEWDVMWGGCSDGDCGEGMEGGRKYRG